VNLLIGPYGSGLVRAVAPLLCDGGRLLDNHGGSADVLARPGLVSLPAPASSYFEGAVQEAVTRRVDRLLVRGPGRFARAVAEGAAACASERGIGARMVSVGSLTAADAADGALLVVGRFEEDLAVVRRVLEWPRAPVLLGAVAAGLPAFGEQLGGGRRGRAGARCSGGRAGGGPRSGH
jgi:hypothetical protein